MCNSDAEEKSVVLIRNEERTPVALVNEPTVESTGLVPQSVAVGVLGMSQSEPVVSEMVCRSGFCD